jgi:hypothetical protein
MRFFVQSILRAPAWMGLLTLMTLPARADLTVRVSVKFILGSGGQRPSMGGSGFGSSSVALVSDQAVQDTIAYANDLMGQLRRGYQLSTHRDSGRERLVGFFQHQRPQ